MNMTLIIALVIFLQISSLACETCLGIQGACNLKLDEVTLAGAHNAGAGFDGQLKYHKPYISAISCAYRNQYRNVDDMLNAGIRYFDVDLCYEGRSGYAKGVWACHSDAYGGPMYKFLAQIDKWINKPINRREVVVLHFNRDHEVGKEKLIGEGIVKLLKDRWNPSKSNIANGKVTMQTNLDALIGDSVKQNKRIYTFLHLRLTMNSENFLFHHNYIGYTWNSMGWVGSDDCKALATKVSDNCPHEARRKFVRLDLYLSWGLCVDDLASKCNKHIDYAAKRCVKNIEDASWTQAKTVNFIVIDYATEGKGLDAVKVAKQLTEKHIASKQG